MGRRVSSGVAGDRAQSTLSAAAVLIGGAAVLGVSLWLGLALMGGQPYASLGEAPSAEPPSASQPETEVAAPALAAEESVEPTPDATKTPDTAPREPLAVIAWQPSHQGDTGFDGWREYEICGDIMERVIPLLAEFDHVEAWTLEHGLTGRNSYRPNPTNTKAYDVEIKLANDASADVFISIHNDGGAPSGVLGMCMPGDSESRALCEFLVSQLCESTGLPNRGIREERLYSLEPDKNRAPLRILLEIGDNVRDRDFLEDPGSRQVIAETLAAGIREWSW